MTPVRVVLLCTIDACGALWGLPGALHEGQNGALGAPNLLSAALWREVRAGEEGLEAGVGGQQFRVKLCR